MSATAATVVITTKNRKEDLARALESCRRQTIPLEVLVIDDGSDDGTSEMIKRQFPEVIVHRSEVSRGYIVQRNAAPRLTKNEIIFSIDDDAEFSTPQIAETVLNEFFDPRIAAVAIPFIDVRYSSKIIQMAPDGKDIWLTNEYIGTAHAIRKSAFFEAGGYREALFHQGEEGDLCVRLLDKGYFVRLGSSDPIHHYESPKRSHERINVFGQRNLILFAWHNVPLPHLMFHLPMTIFHGLRWGIRKGWFMYRVRGTILGLKAIIGELGSRSPVSRVTYRTYRTLKKRGPMRLAYVTTLINEGKS
jgi:glycosyltransferase involved in cell wall biosynthesis